VLLRRSAATPSVGLFNPGDSPAEIGFRWDALKFDTGLYGFRRLQAQDLWKHEAVPTPATRSPPPCRATAS